MDIQNQKWIPENLRKELHQESKRDRIRNIENKKYQNHLIRIVLLVSILVILIFSLYMPLLFILCVPSVVGIMITLNASQKLEKEKQKILYSK